MDLNAKSIKGMLLAIVIVPMVLFLVIGHFGAMIYANSTDERLAVLTAGFERVRLIEKASTSYARQITQWSRLVLQAEDQQKYHEHLAAFYANERETTAFMERIRERSQDDVALLAVIDRFQSAHRAIGVNFRRAIQILGTADEAPRRAADQSIGELANTPSQILRDMETESERVQTINLAKIDGRITRVNMITLFTAVAMLLLAAGLIYHIFNRRIGEPLKQAVGNAQKIADGKWTETFDAGRGDEIGQLLRALENMKNRFRESQQQLVAANQGTEQARKKLLKANEELEQRVTERTKDLELALRQAEKAAAIKSEFLACTSHELRTPLNAIMGFSEMMKQETFGPQSNPKYLEYSGIILENGRHLLSIINDLLDLSRIEAGQLELEEEHVAVDELIGECTTMLKASAAQKQIALSTDVASGLPEIVADKRLVKQVLINLIGNAVKFTPDGGKVIVGGELGGKNGLYVWVRDSGPGMAAADVDKVTMPFTQAASGKKSADEGIGLGLAIAQNYMEVHGGRIEIESELGWGTKVRCFFPAARLIQKDGTAPIETEQPKVRLIS